jgi:hypothetical protein
MKLAEGPVSGVPAPADLTERPFDFRKPIAVSAVVPSGKL